MDLKKYIADIPDFPEPGVIFRDVTPLLANKDAYQESIRLISEFAKDKKVDVIVGPEARGFLFGCPVALALHCGFVPVRKPGKLPREVISQSYDLEYGSNEIQMHSDSIQAGQNVLVVDDLLATGGTVEAAISLIEKMGGNVVGTAFLIELEALKGRELLKGYDVFFSLKVLKGTMSLFLHSKGEEFMKYKGAHDQVTFDDVLESCSTYITKKESIDLIQKAYDYIMVKHEGQKRKSGEPYTIHLIWVAYILTTLQTGPTTIAAGLLHDVMEDCDVPREEMVERFGEEITSLVEV